MLVDMGRGKRQRTDTAAPASTHPRASKYENSVYRRALESPLAFAYTASGGSAHAALVSDPVTLCGRRADSLFASLDFYPAGVNCATCCKALARRNVERAALLAYDETKRRSLEQNPRQRLSALAG